MKKRLTSTKAAAALLCGLCLATAGHAQESDLTQAEKLEQRTQALEEAVGKLQKLKVSGYIQAQYQWGEQDASLKVGGINENLKTPYSRIGIRRGRIKFAYEEGIYSGVLQFDITEKGVGVKDVYINIKDPWVGTSAFKAGLFDRPFGYEISYSSSRRESPERSTIFQTLFPEERDLGGMFTLQAAKTSPWNVLKLEGGLFSGNGIKQDLNNYKDFIGHLSANKNIGSNAKLGLGLSYYNGGVFQGTANVYKMDGDAFVVNSNPANQGSYAKREYFGFDGEFNIVSAAGMTKLHAEYLFGTQPGTVASSKSPNLTAIVLTGANADTYVRPFSGGYVMLVQDFGKLPFSAVAKYDWYDPNTKVSGNEVGRNGTNFVDLSQNTLGFGLLWRASNSIRLTAYYEINSNETTDNLPNFTGDAPNNVFTARLQYKF